MKRTLLLLAGCPSSDADPAQRSTLPVGVAREIHQVPPPRAPRFARFGGGTRDATYRGMKYLVVLVAVLTLARTAHAGKKQVDKEETDRRALSLGVLTGFYAGFTTWAYFAWYHGVERLPEFEVGGDRYFDASTYAGGADKLGHFDVNYALTRGTTRLLRWGGWKPLPASAMAASLSSLYFVFVEVKDGYYYEMSPGDLMADVLGAIFGAVMENSPAVDRFLDFRLEYFPSKQYRDIVAGRAPPGEVNNWNIAEDYTGQRYLLAFHAGELPRMPRWSRYLDVVAGFHTEHYRPMPDPELYMDRKQQLYLGVSLNAQAIWDDLVGHRAGHDVFEVINLPFTSLPVATAERSPP